MKIVLISLLLVFIPEAYALKCAEYVSPNGEKISLENNKGIFAFSLPSHLEGNELRKLNLWVYTTEPKQRGEIAVPVAFKIKNEKAVGDFAILRKGVEAIVTATYTKEMCGPRLERSVNI